MRSTGHGYSQFRRALDRRNVEATLAAAADLPTISPEDALDVCELLASTADHRYPQAARRWLLRYSVERKASVADLGIAADALASLPAGSDCQAPLKILRDLL